MQLEMSTADQFAVVPSTGFESELKYVRHMFIKHALLRKVDCPAETSIPFLASRHKHPDSCLCNHSQRANKQGGGEEEEEEEEEEDEEEEDGLLLLSRQGRYYRSARGYI